MCQQAERWQSSSSNPPRAPEIRISARDSLMSSHNTALDLTKRLHRAGPWPPL